MLMYVHAHKNKRDNPSLKKQFLHFTAAQIRAIIQNRMSQKTVRLMQDVILFFNLIYPPQKCPEKENNTCQKPEPVIVERKTQNNESSPSLSSSTDNMTTPSSLPSLVTDDAWENTSSDEPEDAWVPKLSDLASAFE